MTTFGHWTERRKKCGDKSSLLLMKNGRGNQWSKEYGNVKIRHKTKGRYITLYIGNMYEMTGKIEKVGRHSMIIYFKIRGKRFIRRYVRCRYQSELIKRLCLTSHYTGADYCHK